MNRCTFTCKTGQDPARQLYQDKLPRFENAANTTLNEVIARGVLVKEPGVTEWCSPAVWVPKGDNVRVRLCTDYRELNKMVKRPVHPFQSTREILQAIPVTAKYFAKLMQYTDTSNY